MITKIFLPCFWQAPLLGFPFLTLLLTPTPSLQSPYSSLGGGGSPASSESTSSSRALRPGLWHSQPSSSSSAEPGLLPTALPESVPLPPGLAWLSWLWEGSD